MSIDLGRTLHDVVDGPSPSGRTAGPGRGMTGSDDLVIGHLASRIRRRRVVRTGTRGGVVVGGVQLAGRESAPAPADIPTSMPVAVNPIPLPGVDRWVPPLQDEDLTMGRWLDIGEPAPTDLLIDPTSIHLEATIDLSSIPTVANWSIYNDPIPELAGTLTIVNGTDATFTTTVGLQPGGYLVRDGVVVDTASWEVPFYREITLAPGESRSLPFATRLLDGLRPDSSFGMVKPGSYLVYPSLGFEDPGTGRQIEVYGAPLGLTITGETEVVTPEEQAATDELISLLRGTASADAFPACGSHVPDSGGPLDMDADLSPRITFPAGAEIATEVGIRTTSGRRVVGAIPEQGAAIVVARNGTVVAGGYSDLGEMESFDLRSGDTLSTSASTTLTLCSTGDPLPRGAYLVFVAVTSELDEVTEPDGTP